MKKVKLIILFVYTIILLFSLSNVKAGTTDVDLGSYSIYCVYDTTVYIRYQGRRQINNLYFYKDNLGVEHPAFCLNLGVSGAEDGMYEVEAEGKMNDSKLLSIALQGYPYKTIEELGVANSYEAGYATQFAMWVYLSNLDINSIVADVPAYQRVVNAIKNIYYNGINSQYVGDNTLKINSNGVTDIDNLDRQYYSTILNLDYNNNIQSIKTDIQNITGAKLTDLNNNLINNVLGYRQIKVLIPRSSVNANSELHMNFRTTAKETSVIFAKTKVPGRQDMALTLDPVQLKSIPYKISVKYTPEKLEIYKKDIESNAGVANVKFKITRQSDNKEMGTFFTNSSGKILLENKLGER